MYEEHWYKITREYIERAGAGVSRRQELGWEEQQVDGRGGEGREAGWPPGSAALSLHG